MQPAFSNIAVGILVTSMNFRGIAVVALACSLVLSLHGADKPLMVGMVPDAGATRASLLEKAPLKAYLSKALGREVNLVIPISYNATAEALGKGSLDFAYLGGLTYVKAHVKYGVVPLVQRSVDRQFHTLFITAAGSPIHTLQDLRGKTLAFGDVNSTAGHLIPYMEMREAGIDPDSEVKSIRYTGSHAATAKAAESGAVAAGALDETVYNSMILEGKLDKNKVRVFYISKPFVNYVWVARKDLDLAAQEKFVQAFLGLKEGRNDNVLQILRGKDFIRASNEEYGAIRMIAQQLKMM